MEFDGEDSAKEELEELLKSPSEESSSADLKGRGLILWKMEILPLESESESGTVMEANRSRLPRNTGRII